MTGPLIFIAHPHTDKLPLSQVVEREVTAARRRRYGQSRRLVALVLMSVVVLCTLSGSLPALRESWSVSRAWTNEQEVPAGFNPLPLPRTHTSRSTQPAKRSFLSVAFSTTTVTFGKDSDAFPDIPSLPSLPDVTRFSSAVKAHGWSLMGRPAHLVTPDSSSTAEKGAGRASFDDWPSF